MKKLSCSRCGNEALFRSFIGMRCPICGECIYVQDAGDGLLWSEHKLGLTYRSDGWRWMEVLEPPAWFIENVA
ncbi:MAG: hypothetical protein ABSG42_00040 [Nitrospirota bacterium]